MGKVDDIDYNILSQIFEKVKQIDIIQNAMFSTVNELAENKKNSFDDVDKEEEKKKTEEIFMKKGVGKPRGTLQEKQQQYFDLVKSNKIKNPVQKTLDYYQICKDEKGEWIMNTFS